LPGILRAARCLFLAGIIIPENIQSAMSNKTL
jgi:hypothetical protein